MNIMNSQPDQLIIELIKLQTGCGHSGSPKVSAQVQIHLTCLEKVSCHFLDRGSPCLAQRYRIVELQVLRKSSFVFV